MIRAVNIQMLNNREISPNSPKFPEPQDCAVVQVQKRAAEVGADRRNNRIIAFPPPTFP